MNMPYMENPALFIADEYGEFHQLSAFHAPLTWTKPKRSHYGDLRRAANIDRIKRRKRNKIARVKRRINRQ